MGRWRSASFPPPGVSWLWVRRLVFVAVVMLAAILLYRSLSRYEPGELLTSIRGVPWTSLFIALGWAGASYLCLTGFDWLGLAYVGKRLPYRNVALASFVSLSIGHNIGLGALSSGAIRYRYYSRHGLKAGEVARLVVFCGATVALGLLALAGIVVLSSPDDAADILGLGRPPLYAIGGVCLAVPAAYIAAAYFLRGRVSIWGWRVEMPSARLAMAQTGLGALNFACVAACLHAVISTEVEISYLATTATYVLANATVMLAHVPGGLGVIEGIVTYLLPGGGILPLVLVFRFAYFLVPLMAGGILFAATEIGGGPRRQRVVDTDPEEESKKREPAKRTGVEVGFVG